MRALPACAIFAILVSASAVGQTYRYSDWATGPVQHLMTKEETKQWKAIHSDQEAAAFIDLFWARRDPTPDTPRNEFREEFDARVDLADRQFTSPKLRGAMSDPGKVLILLGPPWQVSGSGSAASITSPAANPGAIPTDTGGGIILPSPREELPRQTWTYAHARKPKFIPQSSFVLVFLDEGHNQWQLGHTERANPDAILMQAVKSLIVSPGMTRAPFAENERAKAFKTADLKKAFDQFRAAGKPSAGPTNLTWAEFVTPDGHPFVSVQLYAPAGSGIEAGQKVTFFGVVENAAGETVEVDEEPATMAASGHDCYVDKSVQLEPGSYTATFGLAGVDGSIVAATTTPMNVVTLDPAATEISPLILSNNIYTLQAGSRPTDPFTFGGLKVVPKGDSQFKPKGDLWYFVELRNPGVTRKGDPSVQVQVDITGKTPKGAVEMRLPLAAAQVARLKGARDRYAVGLAIPLEGFVPGDYTMKVRLVDTVLARNYEVEKKFRVGGL
jgi:GWxTD domain-containing protein